MTPLTPVAPNSYSPTAERPSTIPPRTPSMDVDMNATPKHTPIQTAMIGKYWLGAPAIFTAWTSPIVIGENTATFVSIDTTVPASIEIFRYPINLSRGIENRARERPHVSRVRYTVERLEFLYRDKREPSEILSLVTGRAGTARGDLRSWILV